MKSQLDVCSNRPVFLQLFSIIGPYMYINILHYYYQIAKDHGQLFAKLQKANEEIIPNIRGVVYDSPVIEATTAQTFADTLSAGVTNTTLLSIIGRFSDVVFPYLMQNKTYGICSKLLKRAPILLPQLYLYSKSRSYCTIQGYC